VAVGIGEAVGLLGRPADPGSCRRRRPRLLAREQRVRLADTLIAQSYIDHGGRLVTRDADFRHFTRVAGLRLAL